MKKRILIAPNSFKECTDSVTISELIRQNLSLLNQDLIIKPISDGGDGFLSVCKFFFGGELRKYTISTPYDNTTIECPVLYCRDTNHIYIESAEILGLKVVPPDYRNPLKLSSKGLGELLVKINDDIKENKIVVNKISLGIGGTATIDMGIGMMTKLGLDLLDETSSKLSVLPEYYHVVKSILYKSLNFLFDIIPVVDVINPLFGNGGGIQVFGKQKGASQNALGIIEDGFNNILNLLKNNELQISSYQLSGAGGGIPAAFQIFCDSRILNSQEFICDKLGLRSYYEHEPVDYLITGEGAYDNQSSFGKGAGILIDLFARKVEKIFLICGKMNDETISSLPQNVIPVILSDYFETESESILYFKKGIEMACTEVSKRLNF